VGIVGLSIHESQEMVQAMTEADEPLSFGETLPLPFSDPGGMLILGE